MTEQLTAHAQYDDWLGTAAADDADRQSIQDIFREKGVGDGEYVVAVKVFEQASNRGRPMVSVVVADGRGYDDVNAQISAHGTLRFKEIDVEFTFEEFFSLFKRFSIVLTKSTLGLGGREYEITNQG